MELISADVEQVQRVGSVYQGSLQDGFINPSLIEIICKPAFVIGPSSMIMISCILFCDERYPIIINGKKIL
jgi:hypothetical protein